MKSDDGRKFNLSFAAAPAGSEDSLTTHLIVTLFMAAHDADLPAGPRPSGAARMQSLANFIEENLDQLEKTGIDGFVTMADESGLGVRYSWQTYAERQRDLAAGRNLEKWRSYGKR